MRKNLSPAFGMSLRTFAAMLAFVAAALTVACVSIGDATTAIPLAKEAQPTFDRINCEEIAGTAFRSDAERTWYNENCSRWPLVKVPQSPAGGNVAQNQPPECAAMRGKPYTSNEQRNWYLANCQGTPTSGPLQGGQGGGSDRTNCDEIRGTSYRSSGERDWFLKNCPANGPVQTSSPDRTSCDEIRGTAYRSDNERNWYTRNCPSPTATSGGGNQQQIIIIRPSNENGSNNGQGSNNGRGRD